MYQCQNSVQGNILRVYIGLFTNSACIVSSAGAAADVTLPAVLQRPLDSVTTQDTLQLRLELGHQDKTIIDNTGSWKIFIVKISLHFYMMRNVFI